MSTTTTEKRDVQKLQRAIVDGLEDVKAQDIKVFDTAHLSPLFERVVIASGTSNRQTKALAASVLDSVREAGFTKPRVEGEGNGEWIIVDCGQAVVHIMQPTFRSYYLLEDLWGEKPVRLKLGAAKPGPAKKVAVAASDTAAAQAPTSLRRSSAAKKGVAEAFPSKAALKKAAAKAAPAATKKAPAKKTVAGAPGAAAKKTAAPRKTAAAAAPKVVVNAPKKKPAAKKTAVPAKKVPAARKTSSRGA